MNTFNSIEDINRFLDTLPVFGKSGKSAARFDLEPFRRFCEMMGNPQDQFPAIHVGGTNGKGSTCQIIASVYQQAGYTAGLYTSPHILHFSERFMCNGEEITEDELIGFFRHYAPAIEQFRPTYFELSTAIAFWWFARKEADIGIIEVGLGGRLDATNIITPAASIITNVSYDHTNILGNTIGDIAREKAGIIKPGIPVIVGNISHEAKTVVSKAAENARSRVYDISHLQPSFDDGKYFLQTEAGDLAIETELETPVQGFNIAVAWQTVHVLRRRFPVKRREFVEGVALVRTRYPGRARFSRLIKESPWYFDGAHNYEAIRAMKEKVETIQPVSDTILVLSIMRDKINREIINELLEFNKIFYYSLKMERAATFKEMQQWLPEVIPFPASTRSRKVFFKEFGSKLVIFAGSFYFYTTVRDWLASFTFNR